MGCIISCPVVVFAYACDISQLSCSPTFGAIWRVRPGFSDQVTIPLSYHNFRSCYPICPPFLSQSLSNFYWILSNFYPKFSTIVIPLFPSVTRLCIVVDFPGKNPWLWNPGATRPLLRPKSPAFSCAVCGVSWSLWRRSWHARRPRQGLVEDFMMDSEYPLVN